MMIEGITVLILVSALLLVIPGVFYLVSSALPTITAAEDSGLNLAQENIHVIAPGALNLTSIGLIMLGIGIMVAGFMVIRKWK